MKPIVILGAGLSGLSCAIHLVRAGKKVCVLEKKPHVGGRVSSHKTEKGFLVDEGFQVLLNSYPELSSVVSKEQLELNAFHSGALIFDGKKLSLLANPLRHPKEIFATLSNSLVTVKDKLLVVKLLAVSQKYSQDAPMGQRTTLDFLKEFGFSQSFINCFWKPFLTGVYLDPSLSLGSNYFQFLVRCFGWGKVSLPSRGMAQLPIQMAESLPSGSVRLNTNVKSWTANEVVLESGEKIEASQVVCAFDSTAETSESGQEHYRGVNTFYFTSPYLNSLGWEKWLILVPEHLGLTISHMALLSSVAPEYGKNGAPLLSVSVVGKKGTDLKLIENEVEKIAGRALSLELVARTDVRKALPVVRGDTKGIETCGGVIYCGDRWASPSINGALRSGKLAAHQIITNQP